MRLEMSGFVQKDRFDLNSYLTCLFNKLNGHSGKNDKKKSNKRGEKSW